jgi:hypothetical protein
MTTGLPSGIYLQATSPPILLQARYLSLAVTNVNAKLNNNDDNNDNIYAYVL